MTPQRIQRRRTKGWHMPEGAVYVGRHIDRLGRTTWLGRWGNPFLVRKVGALPPVKAPMWGVFYAGRLLVRWDTKELATIEAVERYRGAAVRGEADVPSLAEIRTHLAGKDLACWCKVGDLCHADVLLEIANGGRS